MKLINIKVALLVASIGILTSCEDFEKVNTNPNSILTPVTSALLTNALNDFDTPASTGSRIDGLYCQYFSETQYTESSLYATPQVAWDGIYAGSLYDLQNIINNNTSEVTRGYAGLNGSNNNQIAIARILKAYRFWNMTDVWGDIPYSEALIENVTPKYDTQQEIYNAIFKELKEAVAQFDAGTSPKGDILFKGDLTKWKKLANSVRLIMALRVSKIDPTLGKAQVLDALASDGGVIQLNDDNAQIVYPGGTYKNPWFRLYDGRKDFAISETIADILNESHDLRAKAFGQTNAKGELVAFPYGLTRDDAVLFTNGHSDYSFILDQGMRKATSTSFVITAAHVYLARAEAAQLGWTSESVSDMYKKGIEASWNQWGVFDSAKFDAFMASDAISLASDPMNKINTQRYLAFYPSGSQGWAEWRRTGIPALVPTAKATNVSKQIPRRYIYGGNEPNFNEVNYKAAIGKVSGYGADSRVVG